MPAQGACKAQVLTQLSVAWGHSQKPLLSCTFLIWKVWSLHFMEMLGYLEWWLWYCLALGRPFLNHVFCPPYPISFLNGILDHWSKKCTGLWNAACVALSSLFRDSHCGRWVLSVGVIGLSYSAIWPGYPFIHRHVTPQKKEVLGRSCEWVMPKCHRSVCVTDHGAWGPKCRES